MTKHKNPCDECGADMNDVGEIHACLRRPSDPAELCPVMSLCPECAKRQGWLRGALPADEVPHLGSSAQINAWFNEGHAAKHGLLWFCG